MEIDSLYGTLFKDFYHKNMGVLYKSIFYSINNHRYHFDIIWGKPEIIFDQSSINEQLPLAVSIISHKMNDPDPRIYIHSALKYKNEVFKLVIMHEIGHIWLHDIVGFNNPYTDNHMDDFESEKWADYFSYCYFSRTRKKATVKHFIKILEKAHDTQMKLYGIDLKNHPKFGNYTRNTYFLEFENMVRNAIIQNDSFYCDLKNAIDITLNEIGNIFN
jgi:hypothetical protein